MKALIASANQNIYEKLSALICASGDFECAAAQSAGDVRARFGSFDVLVIYAPLCDESGLTLAADAASYTEAGVVLVVPADKAEKLARLGVLIVERPISRLLFAQTMKLAAAAHARLSGMRTENDRLMEQIAELRLVDRAKFALMQYLGMTEPQAHRYIEKQAMDTRKTRQQVARTIIKTYEQ